MYVLLIGNVNVNDECDGSLVQLVVVEMEKENTHAFLGYQE